jgi:hypothetical protein
MELLSATATDGDRLLVTLADGRGLLRLEASRDEVAALCDAMEEAALLARASACGAWLAELPAGCDAVRIGICSGRVRLVVA